MAQLPGEMNTSSLNQVSSGGKHSNTGVLQFSGTEPSQSLVRSEGSEVEGIERLERHGASRHIIKSSKRCRGSRLLRSGSKSSSSASESQNKTGDLHDVVYIFACSK